MQTKELIYKDRESKKKRIVFILETVVMNEQSGNQESYVGPLEPLDNHENQGSGEQSELKQKIATRAEAMATNSQRIAEGLLEQGADERTLANYFTMMEFMGDLPERAMIHGQDLVKFVQSMYDATRDMHDALVMGNSEHRVPGQLAIAQGNGQIKDQFGKPVSFGKALRDTVAEYTGVQNGPIETTLGSEIKL